MLEKDLEKRLEEIETKIEELENMILDNKLKIMSLLSEKEGEKFEKPNKRKFTLKSEEEKREENLTLRIKKIREMLGNKNE